MVTPRPADIETPPAALPAATRSRRLRSPGRAAWLSIVPGLGQLYNVQPLKALVFFTGVPALVFVSSNIPGLTAEFLVWWRPRGNLQVALSVIIQLLSLLVFIGFFLCGLIFWYGAAHDARMTAHELNAGKPTVGRWWLFRK